MAQTDARITINLPAEVYVPLKRTCDALGVSMSSMVRDLVEASVPMLGVLEDAAVTLATAPDRHREVIATLVADLDQSVAGVEQLRADVVRLADPRASNTGVNS